MTYSGDVAPYRDDGLEAFAGPPPLHVFEEERLASVRNAERFISPGDPLMSILACQAAEASEVPVGMVSFMEHDTQRFFACAGAKVPDLARAYAFCAYTILQPGPMGVEDMLADPRFRDNPYVIGAPYVRSYAGAPIMDRTGLPLGTLCVLDFHPRAISTKCLLGIERLAQTASAALQIRCDFGAARASSSAGSQADLEALLLILVEGRGNPVLDH